MNMAKNILREYEDGFFDDDNYSLIEHLHHHKVREENIDKEQSKKQTLTRKRIRRMKEGY